MKLIYIVEQQHDWEPPTDTHYYSTEALALEIYYKVVLERPSREYSCWICYSVSLDVPITEDSVSLTNIKIERF